MWPCVMQIEIFSVAACHLNFDLKLNNDGEQSETLFYFGNLAFVLFGFGLTCSLVISSVNKLPPPSDHPCLLMRDLTVAVKY